MKSHVSLSNPNPKHPPSRVMIFIDGGYFRNEIAKRTKIPINDFKFGSFSIILAEKAFRDNHDPLLIRTYYYDGLVEPNESEYSEQKKFYDEIRIKHVGYDVRLGKLVKDGTGKYRQKGVDVLMAIDMVDKANANQYDTAIILAGDLDHFEAIQTVRNKGKQICLAYYSESVARELIRICDYNFPLKELKLTDFDDRTKSRK